MCVIRDYFPSDEYSFVTTWIYLDSSESQNKMLTSQYKPKLSFVLL